MPPKNIKIVDSEDQLEIETTSEYIYMQMEMETRSFELQNIINLLNKKNEELQNFINQSNLIKVDLQRKLHVAEVKLDNTEEELAKLKQKIQVGKYDDVIHVIGVPHRIVHKNATREFGEDIKRNLIPDEILCLAVVKA